MKTNPVVSVIIPVYNVEKYLEECIDSVLNQTYKDIEIILVDDGSTDSSGDICDRYAENNKNICVIHQKNGGLSAARNAGLGEACGEYVYFLDSDDYISSDAIEKLISIAKNDNSDVVFFDAHSFLDNSDKEIKQNYRRKKQYVSSEGLVIFAQLQKNNEFHSAVPLLFLRREFLKINNFRVCSGIYYEDMIFTFEVLCSAEVVSQCKEALYYRRYRSDSIMTSKKNKKYFESVAKVYRTLLEFSKKNNILEEASVKKYICRNAFNVFNNYKKLSSEDKRACKKELIAVKKDILKNNAYGDTALKMKCYSDILWFLYKVFEKTIGKLKR